MANNQIVNQMQNIVSKLSNDEPLINNQSFRTWLEEDLPEIPDDAFLIDILYDNHKIVVCVKELDWQTAMNIDMKSFKITEKGEDYYSEEYSRRNTLSRAIIWLADFNTRQVLFNKTNDILEHLLFELVEKINV